jgi:hypothetical protein
MVNPMNIVNKMLSKGSIRMKPIKKDLFGRNMTYYEEGEEEMYNNYRYAPEGGMIPRNRAPPKEGHERKRFKVTVPKSEKEYYYNKGRFSYMNNAVRSSLQDQYPNDVVVGSIIGKKRLSSDDQNDYYEVISDVKPRKRHYK